MDTLTGCTVSTFGSIVLQPEIAAITAAASRPYLLINHMLFIPGKCSLSSRNQTDVNSLKIGNALPFIKDVAISYLEADINLRKELHINIAANMNPAILNTGSITE